MFVWLAALVLLVVVAQLSLKRQQFLKHFPSPPALPILGHALLLRADPGTLFRTSRSLTIEYGTRYFLHVWNIFAVNICDADAAEALLSSSKHITKGKMYEFLHPWLGRGLLTNSGASWHNRRKLLTPAFHFRILEEFGPQMQRHASRLVEDLGKLARRQSGSVNVVGTVSKNLLRTISETAMGTDLNETDGGEERYFEAVRIVGQSIAHRISRPWLWPEPLFSLSSVGKETKAALTVLHGFTRRVLEERKTSRQQQDGGPKEKDFRKRRLAFLDLLLAAQAEGADMTDQNIMDEVDTFMFEGHETTSMAICWTLFLLGNHPDIQERVRDEVSRAGSELQAILGLPYLEMVIKESLRLYPPVFFISRRIGGDLFFGKQKAPEGSHIDLQIFDVHRDPKHYPDPERFDPDRFLPENEKARHPFAFIPFSGGSRNCIGRRFAMMELKVMISAVVSAFRLRSEHSEREIQVHPDLLLVPKQGIMLHITPAV